MKLSLTKKVIYKHRINDLKQINDELNKISEKYFADLVEVEEQLQIENKKLEVISNLGVTKDAFAMEGWIPKSKLSQIKSTLEKFTDGTTIYELETKEEEKAPTLMSNPGRFRLFEAFNSILFPTAKQGI